MPTTTITPRASNHEHAEASDEAAADAARTGTGAPVRRVGPGRGRARTTAEMHDSVHERRRRAI